MHQLVPKDTCISDASMNIHKGTCGKILLVLHQFTNSNLDAGAPPESLCYHNAGEISFLFPHLYPEVLMPHKHPTPCSLFGLKISLILEV